MRLTIETDEIPAGVLAALYDQLWRAARRDLADFRLPLDVPEKFFDPGS